MNKYLLLVLVLIFSTDLTAQIKFGYVDYDAVLESNSEVAQLNERLEKYAEALRSEADSLDYLYRSVVQEMQGMDVQKMDPNGPERAEYENLRIRFMMVQESLEATSRGLEQRYQQRRSQLLDPFFKKYQRAMDEIALENGVQVILDPTSAPEKIKKALESESVIDLTDQLTQRLLEY
ncbi:MAG: OmpH family outer membrane protein [Balneola sp.]